MPREKIETAFLGVYTLAMLDSASVEVSGWIIKALAAWILRGTLPAPEDVPPECAPLWAVVVEESRRIHEARKEREESGRRGGKQRASNAQATAKLPPSNAQATATERESKKENENSLSSESSFSAPAPAGEEIVCPVDDATIAVRARHIGMTDAELDAWRDYYTMRSWKADPRSPRPMTPAATLASLRRWHANEGIRAARDAAGRRDPSRYAPPPEKGGIDTAALGI